MNHFNYMANDFLSTDEGKDLATKILKDFPDLKQRNDAMQEAHSTALEQLKKKGIPKSQADALMTQPDPSQQMPQQPPAQAASPMPSLLAANSPTPPGAGAIPQQPAPQQSLPNIRAFNRNVPVENLSPKEIDAIMKHLTMNSNKGLLA